MSTPAQVEANRSNAQQSTGPRTPEGKAASSQNATSYGFSAAATVEVEQRLLSEADRGLFGAYHADLVDRIAPRGWAEVVLVERLAVLRWRQRRLGTVENQAFASATPLAEPTVLDALLKRLNLLGRYEGVLGRQLKQAEADLELLQRNRFDRDADRRHARAGIAPDDEYDDDPDDYDDYDDEHDEHDGCDDDDGDAARDPVAATPAGEPAAAQNEPAPVPPPPASSTPAAPAAQNKPIGFRPPRYPGEPVDLVARVATPGEVAVAKLIGRKA